MADTYIMEAETARRIAAAVAARDPSAPGFTGSGLAEKIAWLPPMSIQEGAPFRDTGKLTIGGSSYFEAEMLENYKPAENSAVFPHSVKYTCKTAVPDGEVIDLLTLPDTAEQSPPCMRWEFTFYLQNLSTAALNLTGYNRHNATANWNSWGISLAANALIPSATWRYWTSLPEGTLRAGMKLAINGPVAAGTQFVVLGASCLIDNPTASGSIDMVAAALGANTAAKARSVQPAALQDAPGQDSTGCEVNGNGT